MWMSLQYVMNEILKAKGSNNCDVPHNKKKQLEDNSILPEQVQAPRWAIKHCIAMAYGEEYMNQLFEINL